MAARTTLGSLIGVDVGSTHIKAVLVAPGSGVVHVARRATVTHAVRGGGATHRSEELLGAVESAIAECVAAGAAQPGVGAVGPPRAIGIASMAEAGVPLDARGRPVGDILAWFDPRPAPEAEWLERRVGAPALFARTGLRPEAKYTLPKLLWLRAERPREFTRLRRWAGVAELIAYELTGDLGTNASLACRTAAFSVVDRRWDGELLSLAGLEVDQMPSVLPLGQPVGGLTGAAAARLGLPAGTPIAIAGHDHLAAALGAGVSRPGDALDSMGSAEATLLVTRVPALADELRRSGFSSGCHALEGAWYVGGGFQASGALVEWFLDRFVVAPAGADAAAPSSAPEPDRYAAFLALLDRAGPGAAQPLVRPYLRGRTAPHRDPSAALAVEGLLEAHGLPELAAALIDGAAFHVRWMIEELERVTATPLGRVRIVGGGARNPRWLTAKAALGPGRFEVARTDEAAALGAALVGGVAGGLYGTMVAALADAAPSDRVTVAPGVRARYDAAYRERWLPAVLATLR
ncbi:MAG: FGGY family carbohydrate kinase [Candidatus Limnocylindrales bacterium]